jgi:type II secretory pathway predicted ATPase ExeA/septal ring-binding cell division protein DamX
MTMYLEHFGLREAPFRITPHTEFFFAGANRGATLEALVYAITAGEGLVKVTGEVGTGKTMLCRVLMERLPERVETIYLAVPSLSRDEMLVAIASELGVATHGASTTQLLRGLQERLIALHADGRQVVALIDEAHAMPLETLEEIRLLSNLETGTEKLLQVVLFGQPELDEHLQRPNMRQLRERITHAFGLAPLPPRDIKDYIDFRLRAAGYHGPDLFGPDALRIIAEASEGLTRRINIYADKTLLAAFAAGTHTVSADHARAAVSDTQIVVAQKASVRSTAWAFAAGLAAGTAVGFGVAHLVRDNPPPPAAVASTAPALPPRPAAEPPAGESAAPAPAAAPTPPAPEAAGTAPPPAKRTPTAPAGLDGRLDAGVALLDGATGGQWVVQLMTTDARDKAHLQSFLAEAAGAVAPGRVHVYPSGSAESPKVGVIYGLFESRRDAADALEALPASILHFRPYVRAADAVRADVRRGPAM